MTDRELIVKQNLNVLNEMLKRTDALCIDEFYGLSHQACAVIIDALTAAIQSTSEKRT
jgi:hypothetical protein